MTPQEAHTFNLIIAQFMGAYPTHGDFWAFPYRNPTNYKSSIPIFEGKNIKYTSSWEWLMPVIEKIEEEPYNFITIGKKSFRIDMGWMKGAQGIQWRLPIIMQLNDKRQSAIYGIVEYIRLHNERSLFNIEDSEPEDERSVAPEAQ